MMQYRPEIDGLRAVAVVPVILFHAGFSAFSGGYVGVDVFFVISGYLITSIIYGEIQDGNFSLVRFYERRVRRILPALFLVSLACVPFAWLWMMPDEFRRFAHSLVAVNLFSSNFLFLRESGYFSSAAELKPLLHTWSLAVEEQFYLVFPLVLLAAKGLKQKALVLLLTVLALASFLLAEWGTRTYPLANFYLLPFRWWELGLGAILAVVMKERTPAGSVTAELSAALGLFMIAFAVMYFDRSFPVPGVWSLLPVAGTALIILSAGSTTLVGRVLGWKPLVGVGLVSYSAYLWHQPLFAFARIRQWDEVSDLTYICLSLLSLGLAYLSWRFVEQPFRKRSFFTSRVVFSGAFATSVLLVAFGLVGHLNAGFPSRHEDEGLAQKLREGLRANRGLGKACNNSIDPPRECMTGESPEIIVWGDSYAMHIVDGILSSNPDAAIVQMTSSHCGPFFDIAPVTLPSFTERKANECLRFNKQVQHYLERNDSIRFAALSSPFTQYLGKSAQIYYDGKTIQPNFDFVVERFAHTLDWLVQNDIRPVIFEAPPRGGQNIGLCLARNAWFGGDRSQCNVALSDYRSRTETGLAFLDEVEKSYPVVRMKDYLCRGEKCIGEENGVFLYRDAGHLSREGSRYLGRRMDFYGRITSD